MGSSTCGTAHDLQVAKVQRSEHVRQCLTQSRQGFPRHAAFEPARTDEVEITKKWTSSPTFHWASALAVPTAPFSSRAGVIALPAATVDPATGEEHFCRASVRLSQLLVWNGAPATPFAK